jgi:hypothetical protein
MNALITLALLRRSEKGFALPLALMIGLILIGTGITMISRSQGDQMKVVAQKTRAEGLTGTEAGLARVQDYLNTVRLMATKDSSCKPSDDNCWAGATFPTGNPTTELQKQLVALQTAATCSAPSSDTAASTRISSKIDEMQGILANGGTESIVANASQNRFLDYRIVSYKFEEAAPSDVEFIGQGILTLEGGSRKTVLTNVDNAESQNRLVVSIPVYPSYPVAFNRTTAPALWITEGGIEDENQTAGITASSPSYSQGSKFEGDVVMSDASAFDETSTLRPKLECFLNGKSNGKIVQPTSSVTPLYRAQFFNYLKPNSTDPKRLPNPSTPPVPTDIPTSQQNIEINDTATFPRPGDTETTRNNKPVYEYIVSSIDLDGKTVTITPGNKVIFYVNGNINTNGNGGLRHVCGTTANCNASNFLIIAYKTSTTDPQICLKDKEDLEAFILAPGYRLGLKKTGSGTFTGSMWGKSWGKIPGCSDNQTAIIQGAKWDDLVYNFKPNRLKELPQIGQVLTWCEEAIGTTGTECTPKMPVFSTTSSPTTGTSEGTPTTGTSEGTPTTGTSEGTPTIGTSEGNPTTGTSEGTPTTGTSEGTPTTGTSDAKSTKDSSDAKSTKDSSDAKSTK